MLWTRHGADGSRMISQASQVYFAKVMVLCTDVVCSGNNALCISTLKSHAKVGVCKGGWGGGGSATRNGAYKLTSMSNTQVLF